MTDSLSPATPEMTEIHTETMKRLLYGGPFPTKWRDALIEIRDLVRSLVSGEKVLVDRAEIDDAIERIDDLDALSARNILRGWLSQSGAKQ